MIKIQNRCLTKLALLLLPSIGCFQLARADIDMTCATGYSPDGQTTNNASVVYHTGSGVFSDQSNAGSYSYGPDGKPGHQSFTATTIAPNGNMATATIDSPGGVMRSRSEAHHSVQPGATNESTDDITFHNTSSQSVPITIHWHVDGTLSVAGTAPAFSRATYVARLIFTSGGAGGDISFAGQLSTDPSENSESYSTQGFSSPGESLQIQHNPSGFYGYSVTATVAVPKGDSTWHLYMRLTTGANDSGSIEGAAVSDFSNTSALTFDLPQGISFTSPSGILSAGSRLVNISTRAKVLGGDSVAIGGFIVTGNVPKKVIILGIGPSLSGFFGGNVLADPTLELKQGDTTVATNDNWKDTQQSEIQNSGATPTNDLESGIVRTLNPGTYTAILRGKNDGTGIGVIEVYDLDPSADAKLANISTRSFVDTGNDVLIGGIIGGGNGSQPNVIIRAIGPSLTALGVPNALQDPLLELHDKDGNLVASNDDWQSDQKDAIQATGVAPNNPKESAILATLLPTAYTAIVKGVNNTTGVALVEVYHLQ